MPARLTLHLPDRPARVFPLRSDGAVVIGRAPDCDLVVEADPVSRHHLRLEPQDDGWWVEDLDSKNGTTVDGNAVRRQRLGDRSWLGIGGLLACFEQISDGARWQQEASHVRFRSSIRLHRELNPALGLSSLLQKLLDSSMEVAEATRGFVLLAGDDGAMQIRCSAGVDEETLRSAEFSGSVGAVEKVLHGRRSVVVCDTMAETWLASRPSISGGSIRALVCVPLIALDRLVGVLYADSDRPGKAYTELDVEILEALACHAALALSVARLDGEVRGLVDELRPANTDLPEQPQTEAVTSWQRIVSVHQASSEHG